MDPGPGLNFNVSNDELLVAGDGIYAYLDLEFSFHVSVLDPAFEIEDASLRYVTAGASNSYWEDEYVDLGNFIREDIGTGAGQDNLGTMNVEFSRLLIDPIIDETVNTSPDSIGFEPQSEIWVTKNILLWAVDIGDTASLTEFEQRFSQTSVPEPGTMFLLSAGLAGLAFFRKKIKK